MLPTEALDYHLPPELIATRPADPRDSARMMVVRRGDERVDHVRVYDLPQYLEAGDAVVFNTTAVTPARLRGRRAETGGRVNCLYVEQEPPDRWLVMLQSGGRLRPGDRIELVDEQDRPGECGLELVEPRPEGWLARLTGPLDTIGVLDRFGLTPLPPYILKSRGETVVPDEVDRAWYQTIYADPEQRRSVAAPTAGLHFTPDLLQRLQDADVGRIDVTLHVGPGTFRPITAPSVEEHVMHAEHYTVTPEALAALRGVRGRIIAVGSTAVRTLESLPERLPDPGTLEGPIRAGTELIIAPPYEPALINGMLTNFHLPRTTLLALVAALVGLNRLHGLYAEAIRRQYRFYSYGDAMLILP
ncbi:MAG: tRNA preQ1(34) S-adenosylmethionine ribosyltransferase-isomerase QueA [Planctomycetota bacterium]|jgi:S-adenosylmethionine:tRNA ribosyltransferase-isomerase